MHSIREYVDLFIDYLSLEKNFSENTISNYRLWLKKMVDFMEIAQNKKNIEEIKSMDILSYRSFLNSEWLSKKTVNYHIIAIRSFFKFLKKNNITTLPIESLELSKLDPREIVFLTQEEVDKILKMPEKFEKNSIKRARDLAILYTLYGSWLRVSELINLKVKQISFENNQITITWKWRKQRAVFLTKQAQDYIKEFLKLRDFESEYVITSLSSNSRWKPISRVSVEQLVKDYASLAWIDKKVTPHTLRHSFATTLLMKWADIRSVQMLLWHSSIMTTQIYTHISDRHLQEVHSLLEK